MVAKNNKSDDVASITECFGHTVCHPKFFIECKGKGKTAPVLEPFPIQGLPYK